METGPIVGDAFGLALTAALAGTAGAVVIERDDGLIELDASDYFADITGDPLWSWIRPRLGRRVLDVGAGAGRGALGLQQEGIDVVALDLSAGCVEVCRRRGVRQAFTGTIEQFASTSPAPFDSLLCLGNNIGLIGRPESALSFFGAAQRLGGQDVRIVGTMLDPHSTDNPVHLRYHERNRAAGRLPGQVRLRVRYQNLTTAWFDLLWAAPEELEAVARQSGWAITAVEPGALVYAVELRPSE